ncbi:CsbD family protein [soil metagenome]
MAINAQQLQGQWNQVKGKLKERWGQLSDDDLQMSQGNIDQLIGRIQQKTGEGRESIEKFIDGLATEGSSALESAQSLAHQATDRMREGYDTMSAEARHRYEMAEDMVRQRPGQSVATAFGVGLVVGVLVGLVMRSR